jgi:allantoinase
MSGRLQPGRPDHPHHAWSPLPWRKPMTFANGARVAICPVIAFETHEDTLPEGWPQPAWLSGGVGRRPDPNIARIGQRDYGLRAGWPRLRAALHEAGLRYGAAMDVLTAEELPDLLAEVAADVAAGRAEWVAHGISINRPLHDGMSDAAELAYLQETRRRLDACGIAARGWWGPEYGQSARTPPLLARAGYAFTLDWCNDEQPYAMTVPEGRLAALPPFADLDDAFSLCAPRGITPASYATNLVLAAEGLARDGQRSARCMVWMMRPFLVGQPFRIGPVAAALRRVGATPGGWAALPSEILAASGLLEETP